MSWALSGLIGEGISLFRFASETEALRNARSR